jgi:S-methylmethionine-dependent homocysteine/selenocysteine methylase
MRSVVLTDGGMGQELIRRSGKEPTPMWSAKVLLDEPDLVRALHADFIRSGARTITINTYSATPERLERDGLGDLFKPLQRRGCELALAARDDCAIDGVRIAGCLPPILASYRPDVAPDYETCLDIYRRVVAEQASHVDFFLCETLASVKEIRAASLAAKESGKPVWVGMTVKDDGSAILRGGEDLADAHAALDQIGVEARLLNCSKPEAISASWAAFSRAGGPLGAYANGFTAIDSLKPGGTVKTLAARHDLGPAEYADFALKWVDDGAAIVGGCCEVGPLHIKEMHHRLEAAGMQISGDLQ